MTEQRRGQQNVVTIVDALRLKQIGAILEKTRVDGPGREGFVGHQATQEG